MIIEKNRLVLKPAIIPKKTEEENAKKYKVSSLTVHVILRMFPCLSMLILPSL